MKGTMRGMSARISGPARLAGSTLLVIGFALGPGCPPLIYGLQGAEAALPAQVPPVPVRAQDPQALLVVGHQVFQQLLKSPEVTEAGGSLEWRFFLLNDQSVNAHSDAKGRVWVGGGLAKMLGQDRGLWAAALSHEVAHCLLRHPSRGLAVLHTAFPYVFGKVLRDREHRADAAGMMLMARAGYHPDSLLALHHMLRAAHGEQPEAVAFFGSHPRWQTREQRLESIQPDATAAFQQAWPDAAASPGGPAPLVVFLGAPSVTPGKSAQVIVELACRNASQPVTLVLGVDTAPSNDDVRQRVECAPRPAKFMLEFEKAPAGKRKAHLEVRDAASRLRARSPEFNLPVPQQ